MREGRVILGASGFAGEIGHVQVDPAGPLCTCGNHGCLECYAGRRNILRAAGLSDEDSPETLVAAYEAGEAQAVAAIEAATHALGAGLGAAVNLLDIPVAVLGGHLAPLTGVLRPLLAEELSRRVLAASWSVPEVVQADADQIPGATGAAWALLAQVVADPVAWMRTA